MREFHREELQQGARRIVAMESKEVAGEAVVEPGRPGAPAMVEVSVVKKYRGQGIGTELVRRALNEAGPGAYIWDHSNNVAVQAIVQGFDLVAVRVLVQMVREKNSAILPPLPDVSGVTIRHFRGYEDEEEVLRVNNAAFDWHPEQGGWNREKLRDKLHQPWVRPEGIFLAHDVDGTLVGFHWTKIESSPKGEPAQGEVYVVGVDPVAQGRGLGKLLTLIGMNYLYEQGVENITLYVEETNTAALATYRGLGFVEFAQHRAYVQQ